MSSEFPHHGRTRSWVAVGVIIVGFAAGGVALVAGPLWWLFWTGVGIVVLGGLAAMFSDILSDVILDEPRVIPEEVHYRTLGRQKGARLRGGPYGETARNATATDPARYRPLHG